MEKTCCVTGSRPQGFKWDYYNKNAIDNKKYLVELENNIEKLILNEEYVNFIAGGAMGVDMDFAETVLKLQLQKYPQIKLELVLPFNGHHLAFSDIEQTRFIAVRDAANSVTYTMGRYTKFSYHIRNRYMVDNSSTVLAFWNGVQKGGTFYTLQYAQTRGKNVILVML